MLIIKEIKSKCRDGICIFETFVVNHQDIYLRKSSKN